MSGTMTIRQLVLVHFTYFFKSTQSVSVHRRKTKDWEAPSLSLNAANAPFSDSTYQTAGMASLLMMKRRTIIAVTRNIAIPNMRPNTTKRPATMSSLPCQQDGRDDGDMRSGRLGSEVTDSSYPPLAQMFHCLGFGAAVTRTTLSVGIPPTNTMLFPISRDPMGRDGGGAAG